MQSEKATVIVTDPIQRIQKNRTEDKEKRRTEESRV